MDLTENSLITIEHGEPTAGPQHAAELGERPLRARYVAQARMHDGDIDAGVLKVQRASNRLRRN